MDEERQPQFLGVRAAAKKLDVHENTVRKWAKAGVLDPIKLPGSRYQRFRVADVERLVEERERTAAKRRPRVHKNPQLVDAEYLAQWQGRQAQELLPHVLRRLVEASADTVGLTLRAGDGISAEGWDGEIDDCRDGSPWVPRGPSRWEIGTDADIQAKAQKEYTKRTDDPLGADPSVTAFVFVTQRRWRNAKQWERARKAEGVWRDVRVIEADHLAGWLESYPSVHMWLSEQVGLRPLEVRTLSDHWDRLSSQTRPPLPPQLLLAGRGEAADALRRRLEGDPNVTFIRASSYQEAIAFFAAFFKLEPDEFRLPPAIVAMTSEGWERSAISMQRMVLVAATQSAIDITRAIAQGHHAVIPIRSGDPAPQSGIIDLPPLDRTAAREALESAGLAFERADRLAALARRSYASLLRDPEIASANRDRPSWANSEPSQMLAPLMLMGQWAGTDADHDVVAEVADTDWKDIERQLHRWANSGDPPFIEPGGKWQVASPEGAWVILHSALRESDVERFAKAAVEVLSENNPVLELPEGERPMAGVRGVKRRYSASLRAGIAQGLALMGAFGEGNVAGTTRPARDYAHRVVRVLFEKANDDNSGELWASLSDQLPLLAEASPRAFLGAMEQDLARSDPVLRTIFRDREDSPWFATSSPHTGFLWALETVAWSEDCLLRATLGLARLDELDHPRGKLGNRPNSSLRSILLPWIPRTAASLDVRLKALDRLRERHDAVAWPLQLSLLPRPHDTSSSNSSPRFRAWKPSQERVTISEWIATIDALVTRAIEDAGTDARRWSELVEHLGSLTDSQRDQLIDALHEFSCGLLDSDGRLALWRAISDETAKHRKFSSARWAMKDGPLTRLEEIAHDIEPIEVVERHTRLFDWRPDIPGVDGEDDDFEASEALIEKVRREAVEDTIARAGVAGLRRLAVEAKLPGEVGSSAARAAGDEIDDEILMLFDAKEADAALARGWAWTKSRDKGDDWIRKTAVKLQQTASIAGQASFLLAVPAGSVMWELIGQAAPSIGEQYWQRVNPFALQNEDAEFVCRQLLEHDRPWAAVDYLPIVCGRLSKAQDVPRPEFVVEVLERALGSETLEHQRAASLGYEVGVLLDHLDDIGFDREILARLEWGYFPLLEHSRTPTILFAALADDPNLFVELIAQVYRAKNEPAREADEETAALAHHAYSVLHDWRKPPGLDVDGQTIDTDHLRSWVRNARQKLADLDRADIGDQQIGQLLSGSPQGSDGAWPAEPVRELIEDLVSPDLETGLGVGAYNARGVTSRGVYDGGKLEWELSAQYGGWAKMIEVRWPRTARVLEDLAESYEEDARRNDAEAERRASEG